MVAECKFTSAETAACGIILQNFHYVSQIIDVCRVFTRDLRSFCYAQDNVALIVVLEARDTGGFMDTQAASGKRGQLLCVVTISLSLTDYMRTISRYYRFIGRSTY